MPIEIPRLDDRNYAQLLEELLARVPVHTPEWTDHNDADAAIGFLELISFLGEQGSRFFDERSGQDLLQFLRFLSRLRMSPSAANVGRLGSMKIGHWSLVKEAQIEAVLALHICRMHWPAENKQQNREWRALERDLAAFQFLRHQLKEVMAECERRTSSPTPGATWKYFIVVLHWLLFQCDWH